MFNSYYSPDKEPPECNISANYGEYTTADSTIDITLSASDKVVGLGSGAQMQFSNNGIIWSSLEPYSTLKKDLDLSAHGGSLSSGVKIIYVKVSDALGNFTPAISDTILYVPNRRILEVPEKFNTIQAAIDFAQAGDMVWVAPGSYRGDLVLKSGVRLQGSGPKLTELDASVKVSDNCVIDGFSLIGRFETIQVYDASPIISNNIIKSQGRITRGIIIGAHSYPIIRNNIITSGQSGIFISAPQITSIIENNAIYGNEYGILLNFAKSDTRVEVSNNIIVNNKYGILDNNTSDFDHTHAFTSFNLFWNNVNGDLTGTNKNRISNIADLNVDPKFIDPTNGDFSLHSDSPAINSGNPEAKYYDINSTPNDRGAYGGPSANTPPFADFTIESQLGSLESIFTFNASKSSDRETKIGGLHFRWNWENDDIFDTPFSSNPRITHSYQTLGEKSITLQIRDAGGFVSSVTKQVTVNNQPPTQPRNPYPVDGTTSVPINSPSSDTSPNQMGSALLKWSVTDPDVGDLLHYDLYFGQGGVLSKLDSGRVDTSYTVNRLNNDTFYSWRVDAIDSHGARVQGPVWTFLTEPKPLPTMPGNLIASVLSYNAIQLSWGSKSDRALGYRIERKAATDTSFTLINIVAADETLYIDRASLLGNTTFTYRITAINSSGRSPYSNVATATTYSDLLGDVNNDRHVNITDALIVATYDLDSTRIAPNNGTISLGDVDYSDLVNITDALIIATYDIAPENSSLPFGLGKSIYQGIPPAFKPVPLSTLYSDGEITLDAYLEDGFRFGDIVTVTLRIRIDEVSEKLGAYSARILWNPSELNYIGYKEPETSAFDYNQVITNSAQRGEVRLNAFDVQGVGEDVELIRLRLKVISTLQSNSLKVELTNLMAARTFRDLLPLARVKLPNFTSAPPAFALYQNYPNPFNPQTAINFDVPQSVKVRVDVYNLLGQHIKKLTDETASPGHHQILWDGLDDQGHKVGNGIYFVRLTAGKIVLVKKMMVIK